MKVPNFKITICNLDLYFLVHCVLFGLFFTTLMLQMGK